MNEVDIYAKKIWDYMHLNQEPKPADAIIAFGANDTTVAERAADLYHAGYAPLVICAGGFGPHTPFPRPEAEVFADVLRERGVPPEAILIENKSSNTGENVLFTKKLLEEKGLHFRSFILVHKPYMERRTYATFRKQWPEVDCVVTSPQVTYEEFKNDPRIGKGWMTFMVGDFQRIKEYPPRGFQIPQDIPDDVWAAFEHLVALGYTGYLVKP